MPHAKRQEQIEALFAAALDLPLAQRAEFLAACTTDPKIRDEVESLLKAHDRGGDFLGERDLNRAADLVGSVDAENMEGRVIGPYRVLRILGRGGMGVVYLAHDPRLDREVAIKLLPQHTSTDEDAKRRFIEEAKAASALDHPNIATIYEIGETPDHRLYIAMAYYEGETLSERLKDGALSINEALAIAEQVAEGLAAAHQRGIIHRDIKPANVIVRSSAPTHPGAVKILDFGLAKIAGNTLTRPGMLVGTAAYMSPEQTMGDSFDCRTDIWSLGVMLYELIAGIRPFRADFEPALIYAIRHDQPESLTALRPELPENVAHIVYRCLAKDPAKRYQSAEALLEDLRGPTAPHRTSRIGRRGIALYGFLAGLVLVLLAGAFILWPSINASDETAGPPAESVVQAERRLAVLPLTEIGPDTPDPYFADGLTEELISRLSKLHDLRVIARTSVMPYRASGKSIVQIAEELQVGTVVEGSVRREGNQVRISVQLIDAQTQENLWSDNYDAQLADVLAVQSDIAERVAEALNIQLQVEERRQLARRETVDPDAYGLYLQGRYYWNQRDSENFRKALDRFRRTIDLDPLYAPAWAGLADTYVMLIGDQFSPEEGRKLALAAADRALTLDPDLAEAHTAMATILLNYNLEWSLAEQHYRSAIALNPSYALAHQRFSTLLAGTGRLEEAVRAARRAEQLDPLSLYARASVGYHLYLARRYDEARTQLEATRELDPDFGLTYVNLALLYLQTGQYDDATTAIQVLHSLWGEHPTVLGLMGHTYAVSGRLDEARRVLRQLQAASADGTDSPFHLAVLHLGLKEYRTAIDYLEQAIEKKSSGLLVYLAVDPIFDPIRSEAPFKKLLPRMGISDEHIAGDAADSASAVL